MTEKQQQWQSFQTNRALIAKYQADAQTVGHPILQLTLDCDGLLVTEQPVAGASKKW